MTSTSERDLWQVVGLASAIGSGKSSSLCGVDIRISRAAEGKASVHVADGAALPVIERYGYVWTSLGSPVTELFTIAELDEPDRRTVHSGAFGVHCSAPRAIENFLDLAHFPFIHSGTLGLEPFTEVAAYSVAVSDDGTYCERTGSTLLREFREIESGRNNDRQELAKAITFAKRSKATLVIAKLDRLARNVAFVANLMETRAQFESCDLPGANSMTVHVMAAVAENEAKAISTRTKDALVAAKARGVKLGAHHPSAKPLQPGARAKGQARSAHVNRERAVQDYADVLPIIRNKVAENESLRQVAAHLNAEGYVTRNGAAWSAVQVMRVLNRAA